MNQDGESIWQSIIANLSAILDNEAITLLRAQELQYENQQWTIFVTNKFAKKTIENRYLPFISEALKKFSIHQFDIQYEERDMFLPRKKKPARKAFQSNLNADYQFHNFVPGPSNDQAYAAAQRVGEGYLDYNPLLIYGGTGLGKSHLMHAAGNALRARGNSRVMYLTAETFVNDFIRAINDKSKNMRDFADQYRNVDALLIDDVQFLGGKDRSQAEFFHTFNSLFDNKRQIILTCDRYPKEIEGLEDRLKSRFGSGLAVSVIPPELETRVAILQTKARNINLSLSDEVAFFIASHVVSNVRELEGALRRVFALCEFRQATPTIELSREALNDLINAQNKQISLDNIQKLVAQFYRVSIDELHSKSRKASITRPRQIAMALAKDLTRHSYPEIGQAFGGRDHTTAMHAYKKIQQLCKEDSDFNEEYRGLRMSITG
ncbi:chromosomal replication initiator protein DnaA [Suttonella sp. R2A3]|uniref:chromosomal replication initiator protein DnaA n=1 Tax=Suttonella sp. R2A3 TaxID=2908648 RepID=UPI001F3907F0|nr:chromosomal replication initiator protein DnaA [Suttonella sp. R2A3]UJF23929.1 chromosomal replication initiator protein DnaA [Suttonella sp. R2A3]